MKTKANVIESHRIRVVVVGSDPLRFIGFRALLDAERDMELISAASADEIRLRPDVDVVLLGALPENQLLPLIETLRDARPELHILVTSTQSNDETVVRIIAAGANGFVDEAATGAEFAQAIRTIKQAGTWASRRVLTLFVERSRHLVGSGLPTRRDLTAREKQVLEMLVGGRSNKEIAGPLGIEERTVKAHVAKLMRKAGVQNRIALSVHALTHSLVRPS